MTLNVLALGDSVMWGQGNQHESKFVKLVCVWLASRGYPTNEPVLCAHSGAIASPTGNDAADGIWGEVPEAAPSVLAQSANTSVDPTQIDLVLVNGGINDVSAFHVVMANPFDPDGRAKVEDATRRVFSGPVASMLEATVTRFSKAKIVVLGYYPIISKASRGRDLAKLMKHLPRPVGVPNTIDWVVEHVADELIDDAIEVEKCRMVEQCAAFDAISDQILKTIVADLRSTAGDRIVYARPSFSDENAFAASSSWLWNGSDDPLHAQRLAFYTQELARDPLAWPIYTPLASLCHPNVSGAAAYAEAIQAALSTLGFA